MRLFLSLVLIAGALVPASALNQEFSENLKALFTKAARLGRDRPPVGQNQVEQPIFGTSSWSDSEKCDVCEAAVKQVVPLAENQAIFTKLVAFAKSLCIREKWFTDRVCNGAVDMFKDEVYAILPVIAVSPHSTCSKLLKADCGEDDNPYNKWWNVTMPPEPTVPKSSFKLAVKSAERKKQRSSTVQILHLSDMHMDPWYVPGSEGNCTEPLCCRVDSPSPTNTSQRRVAGKIGDYKCDTPQPTMVSILTSIAKQHQIDAVYVTGDYTPHDVWNQTRARHKATISSLVDIVKAAFGQTPIYMAVGNHEGMPVNGFPSPSNSLPHTQNMSWLYDDILTNNWVRKTGWLPQDTAADISNSGSYSTLVKPGWRVISLNNNYCNSGNWWLLRNSTDPQGELKWLVGWLSYAESHHERVHVFMHLPSGGGDCLKVWSWNFYSIMYRFRNTIAAQFSGHTHDSYYTVYYDDQTFTTPTGINYVGPSITTFTQENSAYQILTADADTLEVLDYDTFYADLPASNANGTLQIKKLYSAKADLGLSDLTPLSWHQLAIRMQTDDALFQKFYSWLNRLAGSPPCDAACKRSVLCELHVSRNDPTFCDRFVPKI